MLEPQFHAYLAIIAFHAHFLLIVLFSAVFALFRFSAAHAVAYGGAIYMFYNFVGWWLSFYVLGLHAYFGIDGGLLLYGLGPAVLAWAIAYILIGRPWRDTA